jgi:hypothetical protein
MMQLDAVNHYRHALDHYFTLTLNEPFLQNSSIGTPYQKWAYFTNEDFGMLSFAIHNLLRYTSRLVHETEGMALRHSCSRCDRQARTRTGRLETYPTGRLERQTLAQGADAPRSPAGSTPSCARMSAGVE